MKPKYEKPTAIPLGEAVKGSGSCNAGSGPLVGEGQDACRNGDYPGFRCSPGNAPEYACNLGYHLMPIGECAPGGAGATSHCVTGGLVM